MNTNPQVVTHHTVTEGPRSFKVYKPCNTSVSLPVVPDDYYNPTAMDLKDAQSVLASRTQALVNAPLQTRAMRESAERAKQERWPSTTIRVRFPDRTQLEAAFSSSDKIKSIYAFVLSCLSEEVKAIKFILYQSPPKRDYKVSDPKVRELTLSELNLAPSSILLLRFELEELNSNTCPAPLKPHILAQATDLPLPPNRDATAERQDDAPRQAPQGRKLPKWFKLGSSELSQYNSISVRNSR